MPAGPKAGDSAACALRSRGPVRPPAPGPRPRPQYPRRPAPLRRIWPAISAHMAGDQQAIWLAISARFPARPRAPSSESPLSILFRLSFRPPQPPCPFFPHLVALPTPLAAPTSAVAPPPPIPPPPLRAARRLIGLTLRVDLRRQAALPPHSARPRPSRPASRRPPWRCLGQVHPTLIRVNPNQGQNHSTESFGGVWGRGPWAFS